MAGKKIKGLTIEINGETTGLNMQYLQSLIMERDALHEVYRGLYDLLGEENMRKLYEHYKGYQIAFPTRLYSREYVQ